MVVNAEVELNLKFPVQDDNQGIVFGNFDPNPSPLKRRCVVTSHFNSSMFGFKRHKLLSLLICLGEKLFGEISALLIKLPTDKWTANVIENEQTYVCKEQDQLNNMDVEPCRRSEKAIL